MPFYEGVMRRLEFTQRRLIGVGDLHGDFGPLFTHREALRDALLVQVGDLCGEPWAPAAAPMALSEVDEMLRELGSAMMVIRGNWDSPSLFDGETGLPRIHFLRDGESVRWNGRTIGTLGGAYSSKPGWPDTRVMAPATCADEPSLLVSHSFPRSFLPPAFARAGRAHAVKRAGVQALERMEDEDVALAGWFRGQKKAPEGWLFGHFHRSMELELAGGVTALGLGYHEIREISF